MDCFQAKKENKREAERQERLERERKEKEKINKMTEEELKKYKEKEKEERIRREIESNKKFDYWFGPKRWINLQQSICNKLCRFSQAVVRGNI